MIEFKVWLVFCVRQVCLVTVFLLPSEYSWALGSWASVPFLLPLQVLAFNTYEVLKSQNTLTSPRLYQETFFMNEGGGATPPREHWCLQIQKQWTQHQEQFFQFLTLAEGAGDQASLGSCLWTVRYRCHTLSADLSCLWNALWLLTQISTFQCGSARATELSYRNIQGDWP